MQAYIIKHSCIKSSTYIYTRYIRTNVSTYTDMDMYLTHTPPPPHKHSSYARNIARKIYYLPHADRLTVFLTQNPSSSRLLAHLTHHLSGISIIRPSVHPASHLSGLSCKAIEIHSSLGVAMQQAAGSLTPHARAVFRPKAGASREILLKNIVDLFTFKNSGMMIIIMQ